MVAEPDAVRLEAPRRVDELDAFALDARLQPRKVLGVAAEGKMMQRLLLRAFDHRAPAMIVAEGLDREHAAVAAHVEAEIAVELLGLARIRHLQHELVERMDAEIAVLGFRRDMTRDRGHRELPCNRVRGFHRYSSRLRKSGNGAERATAPRFPPVERIRPPAHAMFRIVGEAFPVTLRCEAAKPPSLEGSLNQRSVEARAMRGHLRTTVTFGHASSPAFFGRPRGGRCPFFLPRREWSAPDLGFTRDRHISAQVG